MNSFLPYTVAIFNALTTQVVSLSRLSTFPQRFDSHFADRKFCLGLSLAICLLLSNLLLLYFSHEGDLLD